MEDYPRTLRELEARFATEQACREYLARLRWGQEFVCPACDGTEAWPTARGLWMCAACGHQASVIAGTIFQGTRTPLSVWFRAIWWVVSQKNGASALGLQRVLGLGSYRTAWTWLHKLRRAMVRPGRDRVSEEVEVDETLVGGLEAGGGRRHLGKKALVVIAAEVRGRAIGRIRMQRVADASADSLLDVRAARGAAWLGGDHRRAPELPPPAQARLSPRPEGAPWSWRVGRGGLASRPPGRVASQALAPGYASGRRQSRASRLKRFSDSPCTAWARRGTSACTNAGGPMQAYSIDLRERALLDSDAGMKAADVAVKYRVSGSWVRLLKQRRRETGDVAPRVQRHGRRRMLEPHLHTLAALIAEQPDRTLAALKDALGTPASLATIWRAVAALDVTVKKNGPALRTRST